ncbi:MAG: dihydroneopterin aldolase [Bacteroidia bacterium]|nr:dihydroneopterin aldolase [Bacteroidia bacterium]MDW8303092.1 dihydroneopterin aldolase [Bacteroidia bacterium]
MSYVYVIKLNQLSYFGFHGVEEHERKTGNRYDVDIAITLCREIPIENLSQTVNYADIANLVAQVMKNNFKLLEEMALHIITIIEKQYVQNSFFDNGKITKIWVSISKHNPPIGFLCKKSTVELCKEY